VENLVVDHPELTVMGGGRFRLDCQTNYLAGLGCVQRLRSLRCVGTVHAACRGGSALAGPCTQRRLTPGLPRRECSGLKVRSEGGLLTGLAASVRKSFEIS
jgi:hypothetical protein